MKRRILILGAGTLLLVIVVVVGLFVIVGQRVPSDEPVKGESQSTFPSLKGTNLLLESVAVPQDLTGDFRLIVVAYESDQQILVDKWLLPLESLNQQFPQLAGYYVPLLPQDAADAAVAIIGGMTLAAKSDTDRGRTVVVFTDVEAFNDLVNVPNKDEIQLFLLDKAGTIQWRGTGGYNFLTFGSLGDKLTELTSS